MPGRAWPSDPLPGLPARQNPFGALVTPRIGLLAGLLACAMLGACGVTPRTAAADEGLTSRAFPFVRDHVTLRREIIDRCGEPASSYEGGRIVVYWLTIDEHDEARFIGKGLPTKFREENYLGSFATKAGIHNLVLVFDADGVLAQHSLVFVR